VRTLGVFFEVVRTLLTAGVTVVAEAAFQDGVWKTNLEPVREIARIGVVQCYTDPAVARDRVRQRASSRNAHADGMVFDDPSYFDSFVRLAGTMPSIDVDTTNGYDPDVDTIVDFIDRLA